MKQIETVANHVNGYWTLKSDVQFQSREKLLSWQARGLMYTASGYGKKIPTTKQLFILGRWRRMYCSIFSNVGVCFIVVGGNKVIVNDCNIMREQNR
jgi:hypothetical protein